MIELDGPIIPIKLPPVIRKLHGYTNVETGITSLTLPNFPRRSRYAMSRSIEGPWEYKGILNELAGEFQYQSSGLSSNSKEIGTSFTTMEALIRQVVSFRRAVCIDRLYYNEDGTMKRIQMTTEGVQ